MLGFLLYDARSGSTVLAAHLNQYAGIAVSLESGFVHNVLEYPRDEIDASNIDDLVGHLYAEVQFTELRIDRPELAARLRALGSPLSKKRIVDEIIEIYFHDRAPDADVRILKCPRILFHLDAMIAWYPEVKFIHLVRDGRAVFNSKRKSRSLRGIMMERNLLKAATDWRRRLRCARRHPDRTIEIRYEDFISNPDAVTKSVLAFLAVSRDRNKLSKGPEHYSHSIGERQKHLHRNVGKELDPARIDHWSGELSGREILLYEWLNADELRHYGYEPRILHQPHSKWLDLQALGLCFFYLCHYGITRTRNLYYLVFVRKSLRQRLIAKRHEYK